MNNERFQTEIRIDPKTGLKVVGIDDGKDETKKETKKKFKLYKVVVPLVIVSIGAIVIANNIKKNDYLNKKNDINKHSDRLESSFEDTVLNDSILKQLISESEYSEYVKYRDLLEAKQKIDAIDLSDASVYDINYDDISEEYIDTLCRDYYKYYSKHDENFYKTCNQMNSIKYSIEKYGEEYGNELVKNITARILAAKVVDSNNLNPNNVDHVTLDLNKKDKLKVNFDYFDGGKLEKYESNVFKNQGSDFAGQIGENINDNNILESIYNTEVLAMDRDYDIGVKVK